jgi:hypothetical protein
VCDRKGTYLGSSDGPESVGLHEKTVDGRQRGIVCPFFSFDIRGVLPPKTYRRVLEDAFDDGAVVTLWGGEEGFTVETSE